MTNVFASSFVYLWLDKYFLWIMNVYISLDQFMDIIGTKSYMNYMNVFYERSHITLFSKKWHLDMWLMRTFNDVVFPFAFKQWKCFTSCTQIFSTIVIKKTIDTYETFYPFVPCMKSHISFIAIYFHLCRQSFGHGLLKFYCPSTSTWNKGVNIKSRFVFFSKMQVETRPPSHTSDLFAMQVFVVLKCIYYPFVLCSHKWL